MVSATAPAPARAAPAGTVAGTQMSFSIPAQPLSSALLAFGQQSGLQVSLYAPIAAGRRAAPVVGRMTPDAALSRLLTGTGLSYRLDGGVVTLEELATGGSGVVDLSPLLVAGHGTAGEYGDPQDPTGGGVGYVATRTMTGTKTDTPIEDVPRSIDVVTQAQMQDQQPLTVADALQYSAGIYAKAEGDYTDASSPESNGGIMQRGFTSSQFMDGLQSFSYGNLDPEFLDRIEAVNGPSSTQYGQMNPGGIINMSLKKPTATPYHRISVGFGNWGRYEGNLDISDKITPSGNVRYRFIATGILSGTEVDHVNYHRWGVAPSLTWDIDPRTSWSLIGQYEDTPETGSTPFTRPVVGTLYAFPGHGYLARSTFLGDLAATDESSKEGLIESLFTHRFSAAIQFQSTIRWEHSDSANDTLLISPESTKAKAGTSSTASAVSGIYSRQGQIQARSTDTVGTDNHFTGDFKTGPVEHTWLVGVDYRHYTNIQNILTDTTATSVDIWNPVITGYTPCVNFEPGACDDSLKYQNYTRDQVGAYLQDQMRWQHFILTTGLRHDWTSYSAIAYKYAATGLVQADNSTTKPEDDSSTTWETALGYELPFGIVPYFSYATSFVPDEGATNYEGNYLPPMTGNQMEAGIKWKLPHRNILVQASVFHDKENNTEIEDTEHSTASVTYETDGGQTTSQGFEASINANITKHTRLTASYTYVDDYFSDTNVTAEQVDPKTGADLATVSEQGKAVANVPRNMFSVFLSQDVPGLPGVSMNGGVRYVGFTYADDVDSFKVPAYVLADVGAHADLGKLLPRLKGFDARLAISNLTDKYYVASCSSTMCFLGQGRRIYGEVGYRW